VTAEPTIGDLAFGSNIVAQKNHIIRLNRSAYDDDVANLSKHLTKETRAKRIAEIEPKRKTMFNARALCGVEGSHAPWGNYTRYYWSCIKDPSMETVCKGCQREWKKLGEPEIKGWDRSVKHDDDWPWELPFGWQAIQPSKHPWDCANAADIEHLKDDLGKVVGEHRIELRRWVRGPHIVRLVHHLDTDTYSARRWIERCGPDDDRYVARGTLKFAREHCHKTMAQGGY
jgi:hypothetical protein